jgi:hypothetical protein
VTEQWRTVAGFEAYEVSNLGRVRRALPSDHEGMQPVGKIIEGHPIPKGYLQVHLYKDGKHHARYIHRLVAQAFIPNPDNLPEVNHLGKKTDNRAIKLEWRSWLGHGIDRLKREQRGDGVRLNKRRGTYYAGYTLAQKFYWLGSFSTKEEALRVRRLAIANLPNVV